MQIHILRLGHRLPRDERISTHVALVARAFGADKIIYTGQHDSGLETSVERICAQWGAGADGKQFTIEYAKNAKNIIKKYKNDKFTIIHLTMYGLQLSEKLHEIKTNEKLMVIVGSEQVPGEIYSLADYNISITTQPHSEVAALAIILDRLHDGKEIERGGFDFKGKLRIEPCAKGKKILSLNLKNNG